MKIFLIIAAAYLLYFLGQIIYDGFIVKPKKVKSDQDDDNTIRMEDQDHSSDKVETNTRVVNFDTVENSDSTSTIYEEDIQDMSEEDILLETSRKMQEENYVESDNLTENEYSSSIDNNDKDSNSFILKFRDFLLGDNHNTISGEIVSNELDVIEFIDKSFKITSFTYSNTQLI